jgi:hypothetical protein
MGEIRGVLTGEIRGRRQPFKNGTPRDVNGLIKLILLPATAKTGRPKGGIQVFSGRFCRFRIL